MPDAVAGGPTRLYSGLVSLVPRSTESSPVILYYRPLHAVFPFSRPALTMQTSSHSQTASTSGQPVLSPEAMRRHQPPSRPTTPTARPTVQVARQSTTPVSSPAPRSCTSPPSSVSASPRSSASPPAVRSCSRTLKRDSLLRPPNSPNSLSHHSHQQ